MLQPKAVVFPRDLNPCKTGTLDKRSPSDTHSSQAPWVALPAPRRLPHRPAELGRRWQSDVTVMCCFAYKIIPLYRSKLSLFC